MDTAKSGRTYEYVTHSCSTVHNDCSDLESDW